jgi:hypothetical protein
LEEEALLQQREEVGTYGLASAEQPTPSETPKSVTIVCKKCGARLDPRLRPQPRQIRCPDCRCPVEVPSLGEVKRAARNQAKRRRQVPEAQPYRVTVVAAPVRRLDTYHLDRQADVHVEAVAPPPNWAFFSNVFTFPWQSGTFWRWLFLAACWTTTLGLGVLLLYLLPVLGPMFGMAIIFLGLPTVSVTLLTVAYSAACFTPTVVDTAAGNLHVESWPEPVPKEWALDLIYLSFLGLGAAVVGYGIGTLAGLFSDWGVTAGVLGAFLAFPVIMLSALEANSAFVPLTIPILRTFITGWWAWLLFYILTGLMWGGLLFGGALLFLWFLPAVVALGPVVPTVLLIYARLLGRLGWRISWQHVREEE